MWKVQDREGITSDLGGASALKRLGLGPPREPAAAIGTWAYGAFGVVQAKPNQKGFAAYTETYRTTQASEATPLPPPPQYPRL